MPSIDEIIQDRVNRIISVPDRFIRGVGALQSELFAELIEVLSVLDIPSKAELSVSTISAIDDLLEQYYERLRGGKYGSYVTWFTDQMQSQSEIIVESMGATYADAVAARSREILNVSKTTAVRELLGDDFKTNFINVVRDNLTRQVTGGTGFEGLVQSMRSTFFPEGRDGQILNWAKQVASDRFAITDRSFGASVANDLGLVFFQYVGGIIEDSREFCIDRDEKYFHREEAKEWAGLNWSGKFRNTTTENILEVLGGYRCQHVPAFVSDSVVPQEVKDRAAAKGMRF